MYDGARPLVCIKILGQNSKGFYIGDRAIRGMKNWRPDFKVTPILNVEYGISGPYLAYNRPTMGDLIK